MALSADFKYQKFNICRHIMTLSTALKGLPSQIIQRKSVRMRKVGSRRPPNPSGRYTRSGHPQKYSCRISATGHHDFLDETLWERTDAVGSITEFVLCLMNGTLRLPLRRACPLPVLGNSPQRRFTLEFAPCLSHTLKLF
jgi:hypothetical protein